MSTVKSATQLLVVTEQCSPISSQSLLTFELFSVMVHSGSAAGGHYYACIKSFSDGQWYSFNDQHVSKVSLCSWVTRFGFLLKVNVRQCLPFLYTRPKKTWQLQLPFKMLLIVIVVTSVESFFLVSLCSFLSNRSPRMISGKHTGDPQGAEAITPVPLQGQLCSTAVTGLETSWQPPVGRREKNVYFLARWWRCWCCTKNLHVIALVDHIVQKAILRWFSCSTVYLHAICFTLWLAAATLWLVRECTFFSGVADFVIEDSLTSNASNTLTLENEWCLSCYSHLFLNVKSFIFPPFVFVILFLLK